jgi:hypothetical protein
MGASRRYLKTTALFAVVGALSVGLALVAAFYLRGVARALFEGVGSFVALVAGALAVGGLIVLYRSRAVQRGQRDLFLRANARRGLDALSTGKLGWGTRVRRLFRALFWPSGLLVGDLVQVRSLGEIEKTLDATGCVGGLPFMAEMAAFCGRRFRVFRCVDKVFDYGRSWKLRRIDDVVLLSGLRCDGSAHGGCQASCSLLWKTAWLTRVPDASVQSTDDLPPRVERRPIPAQVATGKSYVCQFTQQTAASRPLSRWDIRQDLRPLFSGNLTLRAFCVAMLTRVFNRVERLSGGPEYPELSHGTHGTTPAPTHRLVPGDTVRVLESEKIAATLDAGSRNRGLAFDHEMVKYCGQHLRVSRQIDRIIDVGTGRLLSMKTPCLVLQGVENSGEFMRFWAQQEYLYWREVWLEPEASAGNGAREHQEPFGPLEVERAKEPEAWQGSGPVSPVETGSSQEPRRRSPGGGPT